MSALVALLGLWTVGSGIDAGSAGPARWGIVGLGVLVALAGGYNTVRQAMDVRPSISAGVWAVFCGLCLVLVGLVVETNQSLLWSPVASGTLIAVLAGYNSYRARERREVTRDGTRR